MTAEAQQPIQFSLSELADAIGEIFRSMAFENRSILHPRRLKEIASLEAEHFIKSLYENDSSLAWGHGKELLKLGLGERTILALCKYYSDLAKTKNADADADQIVELSEAVEAYIFSLLEGYMAEREAGILVDQEQLRQALSTAFERQGRELHIKNHAIDTSINGIILSNLEDSVNYVNKAFLDMWGYEDPEEVLGKQILHFLKGLDTQKPMAYLSDLGGGWRGELTAERKDKSTFEVEISASLIRDKSRLPIGIMAFLLDITERKYVEEQIRKLNQELEQRVLDRTMELQEIIETLKETQDHLIQAEKMSALGSLVAGVAHEINTPVGIGVTVASFLQQKTDEFKGLFDTDNMKRSDLDLYLVTAVDSSNMILSNLNRAVNFIQTFKQVAVDQSSEERRTFKMKEYINDVLFSLRPTLKKTQHAINVNCPDELELYSYPGAFSQIITNLVVNSLNHGFEDKEDGEITFEVSETENNVRFRYSDNGKGVDEQKVKRIFDPFYTTKRGSGGSGLGLHIVYNVVNQTLGGQIHCTSAAGEGITFDISLPKMEK